MPMTFDPFSAGIAAFQLINGLQQAEMIRANGRLMQEVAEFNAEFAEVDAYEAEKMGYTRAARYSAIADDTISKQTSALAAQDIDVNFGTAADIRKESQVTKALNLIDIQNEAYARAQGFKNEARRLRLQGYMSGLQSSGSANSTQAAGVINAVSGYAFKNYTPGSTQKAGGISFSPAEYHKPGVLGDFNF